MNSGLCFQVFEGIIHDFEISTWDTIHFKYMYRCRYLMLNIMILWRIWTDWGTEALTNYSCRLIYWHLYCRATAFKYFKPYNKLFHGIYIFVTLLFLCFVLVLKRCTFSLDWFQKSFQPQALIQNDLDFFILLPNEVDENVKVFTWWPQENNNLSHVQRTLRCNAFGICIHISTGWSWRSNVIWDLTW